MSNCFDFRCPNCGDEDHIDIEAVTWIRATGDGTDADLSLQGCCHDFTPDSMAMCGKCNHQDSLRIFMPEDEA